MNRRQFVQVTATSALVPGALLAASGAFSGGGGLAWDYVFFDERFAAAQRWARELGLRVEPIPVQGDVTGIWINGLARVSRAAPLSLQGVTTESFHFCLRILLGDHATVATRLQRLDRDLYAWSIRTDTHPQKGTLSWQNPSHRE